MVSNKVHHRISQSKLKNLVAQLDIEKLRKPKVDRKKISALSKDINIITNTISNLEKRLA